MTSELSLQMSSPQQTSSSKPYVQYQKILTAYGSQNTRAEVHNCQSVTESKKEKQTESALQHPS